MNLDDKIDLTPTLRTLLYNVFENRNNREIVSKSFPGDVITIDAPYTIKIPAALAKEALADYNNGYEYRLES